MLTLMVLISGGKQAASSATQVRELSADVDGPDQGGRRRLQTLETGEASKGFTKVRDRYVAIETGIRAFLERVVGPGESPTGWQRGGWSMDVVTWPIAILESWMEVVPVVLEVVAFSGHSGKCL